VLFTVDSAACWLCLNGCGLPGIWKGLGGDSRHRRTGGLSAGVVPIDTQLRAFLQDALETKLAAVMICHDGRRENMTMSVKLGRLRPIESHVVDV
jgi:hypothetical protein